MSPPVPSGANATLMNATQVAEYFNTSLWPSVYDDSITEMLLDTNLNATSFGLEVSNMSLDASLSSTIYFKDFGTSKGRAFNTTRAPSHSSENNESNAMD